MNKIPIVNGRRQYPLLGIFMVNTLGHICLRTLGSMGKTFLLLLTLVFLTLSGGVHLANAQDNGVYSDTLLVSGPNLEHLSKYMTFWVDSTGNATVVDAAKALEDGRFAHWDANSTLNLGLNPYPLWLHLRVKNTGDRAQRYWWSIYSHADTIKVYEKSTRGWTGIDTIGYGTPLSDRKVKVRFSATEIDLRPVEGKELLLRVLNYRHTQNAIMDFTTPEHNLLWEKKFYWSIGFFVGCFLLICIISFFIGAVLRERTFLMYGTYLLLVIAMALMEELMVPMVSNPFLFFLLKRMHALPVAIIALGIHYHIIMYIIKPSGAKTVPLRTLTLLNNILLAYGVAHLTCYLLFMEKLAQGQWPYPLMWYAGITIVFLILLITLIAIVWSMYRKKLLLAGIVFAFIVLYFNPAGYFLNYAGIVSYYKITYPNYLYWMVCAEIIAMGCILAWRYRRKEKDHYLLLEEKALREEEALSREIEIQEQERKQIARDLHDDLGTTLSAIKLIITNSYAKDRPLVNMITKANTDLRHFFNKLALPDLNGHGLFQILREKVDELNNMGKIAFRFIGVGTETLLGEGLKPPLIRISVELLSNVLKHSGATEATLQLIIDTEQAQLIMEDNGHGYDTGAKKKGMGIGNVRARARRWNGEVHISSSSTGTTTIITIPNTTTKFRVDAGKV